MQSMEALHGAGRQVSVMDGLEQHGSDALRAVKEALRHFARSRASQSREEAERDFGELLLYLLKLAGRMNIDVMAACQDDLSRLAGELAAPRPARDGER